MMDDRMPRHTDFLGVEYSPLYMCKPKRGVKREESKDVYKLPHRLIEKKRRDRINECIGQLKDLLPEHLKLTTLGHLEKAVVLELTLKHLNALTAVTEQQHQKIIALQSGDRSVKPSVPTDLDAFHSGFQTCAKEVLQYLNRFESWTAREQRCTQLVNHLHKVSAQYLPSAQLLSRQLSTSRSAATEQERNGHKLEAHANCVPVIQRTHNGELNENDTDTDSGYGGEVDKFEGKLDKECNGGKVQGPKSVNVKQESGQDPPAKRTKTDSAGIATVKNDPTNRPDVALLNSLIGFGGVPFGQQAPFCMPFYFINPSTAASYMPLIDKSCLEKYFQSAATSPFPLLYPGLSAQAAAAAGFPDMFSSDKSCGPGVISQNSDCQSADLDDSKEEELSTATENDLSLDTENPDHESHVTDNEGT